jgi:ring-1,2-phenylacetyl-CoA epoxidase subunit PaaD
MDSITHMTMTKDQVLTWLEEVKDPEIPVLSLVDLGVITDVQISHSHVKIEMTPTFVGCPALDFMKNEIMEVLTKKGVKEISVDVTFRQAWNSDMISEKGKQALKKFGLAPPPAREIFTELEVLEHATCPRCDGTDTELKSAFGPTLCRSIYYCNHCREAFEQFKPV